MMMMHAGSINVYDAVFSHLHSLYFGHQRQNSEENFQVIIHRYLIVFIAIHLNHHFDFLNHLHYLKSHCIYLRLHVHHASDLGFQDYLGLYFSIARQNCFCQRIYFGLWLVAAYLFLIII